jgi:uncharacterized protein YbjQ (UPF0145 family)
MRRKNMIVSTTPIIEGQPVREYLGVVTGETVLGINMFKDIFAGVRDIIGGRSATYERELLSAQQTAINELIERAQSMGANAVIGVDIDYTTIGSNGSMLMVAATGTAVVI